jgi:hypothetical protein
MAWLSKFFSDFLNKQKIVPANLFASCEMNFEITLENKSKY